MLSVIDEALLQAAAACLAQGLRDRDLAVRWGGGELLLALLGTDAAGAARVAERCRQRVAELFLRGPAGEPLRASLSSGLATLDARSSAGVGESGDSSASTGTVMRRV